MQAEHDGNDRPVSRLRHPRREEQRELRPAQDRPLRSILPRGRNTHQRHRELLGGTEARSVRHLPQRIGQVHAAVRGRVLLPAQPSGRGRGVPMPRESCSEIIKDHNK